MKYIYLIFNEVTSEDIKDEIEHLSNFLLLKISRILDFIIRSSCNSCNLVELESKVEQSGKSSQVWKKLKHSLIGRLF